jgi:hypothetical protein
MHSYSIYSVLAISKNLHLLDRPIQCDMERYPHSTDITDITVFIIKEPFFHHH